MCMHQYDIGEAHVSASVNAFSSLSLEQIGDCNLEGGDGS